jgi:hypothetical protein
VVRLKLDVIIALGMPAALAAKQAAAGVIPIVASVGDAIGSGLASSLARPSSNITGVSDAELSGKRLEIQRRIARPVYSEDCRGRYHAWGAGGKGGNDHDSNCVLRRCCAAALANVPSPLTLQGKGIKLRVTSDTLLTSVPAGGD